MEERSYVRAEIRTARITESLRQGLTKDSAQYPQIEMIETKNIHNRFLIVDDDIYHIGASLKDVGKKLFAFILPGKSYKDAEREVLAVAVLEDEFSEVE